MTIKIERQEMTPKEIPMIPNEVFQIIGIGLFSSMMWCARQLYSGERLDWRRWIGGTMIAGFLGVLVAMASWEYWTGSKMALVAMCAVFGYGGGDLVSLIMKLVFKWAAKRFLKIDLPEDFLEQHSDKRT